jgi:hypothetical protein
VDTIVATSRLAGLYEQWGDHIAAEARRFAPEFHIAWSALPG